MSSIYNFLSVSDRLSCSGQPHATELSAIAVEGYDVVINLGLADGKYALKDEEALVKHLGMIYYHIPVLFNDPKIDDFTSFTGVMNQCKGEKTLVHCAANYRASAFTGLYLLYLNELDERDTISFIEQVWQPDAIWEQFIEECIQFLKHRQ